VTFTEADWRRRLQTGTCFLARPGAGAGPVGTVTIVEDEAHPGARHLVGMWVQPDRRGTGIAAGLLEAACAEAAAREAEAVVLWVADGNDRAAAFYARHGFVPTGLRMQLPSDPSIGEELFRRPLDRDG
jgi:ribosomal protein S18 acetylase RimI-like enzyme